MSRLVLLVCCAVALATAVRGAQSGFGPQSLEPLFTAYAAGDFAVVARNLTSQIDFDRIRDKELEAAIERWKKDRQPVQAAFLLDLALTAHNRRWDTWLDVVCMAREFMTSRPLAGASPEDNAFEIAWHKTSIALLEGQRRPDFVAGQGVDPLDDRMAPEPRPGGSPRLVDPWIELARGRVYEQRALVGARLRPPDNCYSRAGRLQPAPGRTLIRDEGPRAIEHYDNAARYPATAAEALVRKSWVLVQLGRPAEALAALDAISTPFEDEVVRYWSLLFRGRALAALDRPDVAVAAYDAALRVAPDAQAPHMGALALEMVRGNRDAAYARAALVRKPRADDAPDPWWVYWSGDFRLFEGRMASLRRMAR